MSIATIIFWTACAVAGALLGFWLARRSRVQIVLVEAPKMADERVRAIAGAEAIKAVRQAAQNRRR